MLMEDQFEVAVQSSCAAVTRAVQKNDEEKSPSSLDGLLYHAHQLHRLLLARAGGENELEQVGRSITLLNELEETLEDSGYVASVNSHTQRGRPKFDIGKEQIEHLLKLKFSCPRIASLLGVSLRTIRRRMTDFSLTVSNLYSEINNNDLERTINGIYSSYPNCGYRMMDGHLCRLGIRVTQARIRNCMHVIDPEGVALRWRQTIHTGVLP